MPALICGSLAFDTITVFPGRFAQQILPDQLHILNVSFLVPTLRREFGGCAGNIAYTLRALGGERQVLCVSHLPQVAARAEWQWQVSKETRDGATLSSIQPLGDDQRVREIARMLGGVEVTDITLAHAGELLRSTPVLAQK